ncbi:hypothetical protein [Sulfurimonas sp.]|jgi:hypothetical protein|uniref:hypothetical protein n=1 Tax=Sulfurimonas sp. TaxID=2022749 RepID=UPI0025DB36A6|nr:hypothetical protein [Sulfurimonas sp.]MBT5934145.1 hypothetical protein [Sulfurimonas sp.]
METELEKLGKVGIQKISEDTHIPVQHIRALLSGTFNSFSRVQFLGFISILEREYSDKLISIKRKGLEYFDEIDVQTINDGLFVAPKHTKKKKSSYLFIMLLLFTLGLFYTFGMFDEKTLPQHKIDSTKIEEVHKNIKLEKSLIPIELSSTKDGNLTVQDANSSLSKDVLKSSITVEKSFKIVAKSKVWIGYINLKTGKQYHKTFTKTLELDPKNDWLIIFGHPHIDMSVNGNVIDFGERKNIRFLYENGSLITINDLKFQELNKGSKW